MKENTSVLSRCLCMIAGAALGLTAGAGSALAQTDCPPTTPFEIVFSNDIGADTELSDPNMDGDEVFDPGDLYLSSGVALGGAVNGLFDDAFAFGFDPAPDPFLPGSAALTCSGANPLQLIDWFDLDGADLIDIDLRQFVNPDVPAQGVIPFFTTNCVYEAKNLLLSWDDDRAPHYAGTAAGACFVPVNSLSPFAALTYGDTGSGTEVFSATVTSTVPTGFPAFAPYADETGVHASYAPNPDGVEEQDDDTDALDIVFNSAQNDFCPFWYWTADHEASFALDPGDVYMTFIFAGSANFTPVIDDVVHLGLSDDVDLDAIEFVWVETDPGGVGSPLGLALLFSVDDDDPLTPGIDESGGLLPDALYISYLTGFSLQYTPALGEDIDAVTNWCSPFDQPEDGACCFCDGSCADGFATAADCDAAGGKFQGVGSTCATVICEPWGACCLPDGSCVDMITKPACEDPVGAGGLGGIYQGDCLTCNDVDCPPNTEACCFCDGICADLPPAVCLGSGGTPQGAGTICAGIVCPRTGACCLCDGSCVDDVTPGQCQSLGGIFQGICSECTSVDCVPFGACCLCDGTCLPNVTQADCSAQGGKYQGDCTDCDILCVPWGACCLPDGTCIDMVTQAECEDPLALNGIYQGDCSDCANVVCDEITACCLCDGTCIEVLVADCLAMNGKVFPNTPCIQIDCIPFGACCLPDGSCVDMVTFFGCEGPGGLGGIYQGDCSTCDEVDCPTQEPGSCCFGCEQYPGGPPMFCIDVSNRDECCDLQGLFLPGVPCAANQCDILCPADLNGDGAVDVFDFSILASKFGTVGAPGRCCGDLNCDGRVDVFDFSSLAANFGCVGPAVPNQCCSP